MGWRLTGSSDLYQHSGRRPYASINFVVAHDGFTLHDLVSYNERHNEANGEENRDGASDNQSWNFGAEGPTDDPAILRLREQQKRNLMATLLLSQGVPMICGGDEIGRTQNGNNNAYCQDNPISWHDWTLTDSNRVFLEFTKELIRLRRAHPIFRRKKYFSGRKIHGTDIKNITWHRPDGEEMTDAEWNESFVKVLGLRLSGEDINEVDEQGEPARDETFLILMNAHYEPISFILPREAAPVVWQLYLNTVTNRLKEILRLKSGEKFDLAGRSLALFKKIRS